MTLNKSITPLWILVCLSMNFVQNASAFAMMSDSNISQEARLKSLAEDFAMNMMREKGIQDLELETGYAHWELPKRIIIGKVEMVMKDNQRNLFQFGNDDLTEIIEGYIQRRTVRSIKEAILSTFQSWRYASAPVDLDELKDSWRVDVMDRNTVILSLDNRIDVFHNNMHLRIVLIKNKDFCSLDIAKAILTFGLEEAKKGESGGGL